MTRKEKKTGLIFFPAFDWAISETHPEREERLLYTQDQVFEEGLLDLENIMEFKPGVATYEDINRCHICVPDPQSRQHTPILFRPAAPLPQHKKFCAAKWTMLLPWSGRPDIMPCLWRMEHEVSVISTLKLSWSNISAKISASKKLPLSIRIATTVTAHRIFIGMILMFCAFPSIRTAAHSIREQALLKISAARML